MVSAAFVGPVGDTAMATAKAAVRTIPFRAKFDVGILVSRIVPG
jgi:hypothetical protein